MLYAPGRHSSASTVAVVAADEVDLAAVDPALLINHGGSKIGLTSVGIDPV
jgi:hypothetical protein